MNYHQHTHAPDHPTDGDTITCACGYTAVYVDLNDGQPGEWLQTSRT